MVLLFSHQGFQNIWPMNNSSAISILSVKSNDLISTIIVHKNCAYDMAIRPTSREKSGTGDRDPEN